jgi:hypothetical protein
VTTISKNNSKKTSPQVSNFSRKGSKMKTKKKAPSRAKRTGVNRAGVKAIRVVAADMIEGRLLALETAVANILTHKAAAKVLQTALASE